MLLLRSTETKPIKLRLVLISLHGIKESQHIGHRNTDKTSASINAPYVIAILSQSSIRKALGKPCSLVKQLAKRIVLKEYISF